MVKTVDRRAASTTRPPKAASTSTCGCPRRWAPRCCRSPSGARRIGANDRHAGGAAADHACPTRWPTSPAPYLEFVVSLSAPSTQTVSVSYNNSNVTAPTAATTSRKRATLTFAPGRDDARSVKIPVLDTRRRRSRREVLTLNLFSAVNAHHRPAARPSARSTTTTQTSGHAGDPGGRTRWSTRRRAGELRRHAGQAEHGQRERQLRHRQRHGAGRLGLCGAADARR